MWSLQLLVWEQHCAHTYIYFGGSLGLREDWILGGVCCWSDGQRTNLFSMESTNGFSSHTRSSWANENELWGRARSLDSWWKKPEQPSKKLMWNNFDMCWISLLVKKNVSRNTKKRRRTEQKRAHFFVSPSSDILVHLQRSTLPRWLNFAAQIAQIAGTGSNPQAITIELDIAVERPKRARWTRIGT